MSRCTSLDDAKLLMDQSGLRASHSSSRSVEAREEASFDEEETSTWLKVEKKQPKSSSGDLGKIAQDEALHSGKKTSSGDLGKIIAHDEDEQHSDKIGVHAIEDHKQDRGAEGHVQALLDMDGDN